MINVSKKLLKIKEMLSEQLGYRMHVFSSTDNGSILWGSAGFRVSLSNKRNREYFFKGSMEVEKIWKRMSSGICSGVVSKEFIKSGFW